MWYTHCKHTWCWSNLLFESFFFLTLCYLSKFSHFLLKPTHLNIYFCFVSTWLRSTVHKIKRCIKYFSLIFLLFFLIKITHVQGISVPRQFISGSFFPSVITVLDDEDSNNITAGSIVTVTVTLTRKRMAVRMITCFFSFFTHKLSQYRGTRKNEPQMKSIEWLSCFLEVWLVFSDDH